jgi:triacylglycerol esterase/lipase EstA (alpha/beta hydrolase family)
MIARIQRLFIGMIALAAGILAIALADRWSVAMVVICATVPGFALVIALQFAVQRHISRSDIVPAATLAQTFWAWMGEVRIALKVFLWWQPFFEHAVTDHEVTSMDRRGIVFVHGFFCNRGLWTPWLHEMKRLNVPFIAVSLEPVFGSIDKYAGQIDGAVKKLETATGRPPILICHSMGGLAARGWLRAHAAHRRIGHLITIGTPHSGTWFGRLSHATNGRQMALGSSWLTQLASVESCAPRIPTTCWYSNCDNIVFPPSAATLEGADNLLLEGVGHVDMAFQPQVLGHALAILDRI